MEKHNIQVTVTMGADGKAVVFIDTPDLERIADNGSPDFRIWINDALVFSEGIVGDDLELPEDIFG